MREIERLVSGHRPGSLPNDVPDPGAHKHVLRFEVSGEALATFREAIAQIKRDAGEPLDDDAALLLMARHVLAGPADEGRASYQVELSVCEHCQRAQQLGSGELVDVSAAVAAMADCDGQNIAGAQVGPKTSGSATRDPVRMRAGVIGADRRRPFDDMSCRDVLDR